MRITNMNWMQVEAFLRQDDRCILPLGCTEQHAYLSLSTDSILAERIALEAAQPLGVPVFPVVHYGLTPYFASFPGTVSLRVETYMRLIRDILDSLTAQGFLRILIVNGHGGNTPVQGLIGEWVAEHRAVRVKFHSWWNAPKTWAKVVSIDPNASHASWMENFPWTRLGGIEMPEEAKPMIAWDRTRALEPDTMRAILGDGNYGGLYARSDEEMTAIWQVAVQETRDLLTDGWE